MAHSAGTQPTSFPLPITIPLPIPFPNSQVIENSIEEKNNDLLCYLGRKRPKADTERVDKISDENSTSKALKNELQHVMGKKTKKKNENTNDLKGLCSLDSIQLTMKQEQFLMEVIESARTETSNHENSCSLEQLKNYNFLPSPKFKPEEDILQTQNLYSSQQDVFADDFSFCSANMGMPLETSSKNAFNTSQKVKLHENKNCVGNSKINSVLVCAAMYENGIEERPYTYDGQLIEKDFFKIDINTLKEVDKKLTYNFVHNVKNWGLVFGQFFFLLTGMFACIIYFSGFLSSLANREIKSIHLVIFLLSCFLMCFILSCFANKLVRVNNNWKIKSYLGFYFRIGISKLQSFFSNQSLYNFDNNTCLPVERGYWFSDDWFGDETHAIMLQLSQEWKLGNELA